MNVIISLLKKGSRQKVWRFSPKRSFIVVGKSRLADISLPECLYDIYFALEHRSSGWWLLNVSGKLGEEVETQIIQSFSLKMESGELLLEISPDWNLLNSGPTNPSLDQTETEVNKKSQRVICFYYLNQHLIYSLSYTQKEFSRVHPALPTPKNYWQVGNWDPSVDNIIYYKQISIPNGLNDIKKIRHSMSSNEKLMSLMIALIAIIGLTLYLILPREHSTQQIITQQTPPAFEKVRLTEVTLPSPDSSQPKSELSMITAPAETTTASSDKQERKAYRAQATVSRLSRLLNRLSSNPANDTPIRIENGPKTHFDPKSQSVAAQNGSLKSVHDAVEGMARKPGFIGQSDMNNIIVANGGNGSSKAGKVGVNELQSEADVFGEGLDPEVIAAVIRKHLGEILYCYERQLSTNPELIGKVSVKFVINPVGGVDEAKVVASTMKSPQMENCITGRITRWSFPKPKGASQVVVTYPFLFKNTQN